MHLQTIVEAAGGVFLPWTVLSVIIGPRRSMLALIVMIPLMAAGLSLLEAAWHHEAGALAVLGEAWKMTPFFAAYVAAASLSLLAGWGLRKARGLSGDQSPFPVTRSS